MKFIPTLFADAWIIEPKVFQDNRGFFLESYSQRAFAEQGIAAIDFVQDNHSLSREKGVLRGLHLQLPPHAQTKLLRVTAGAVYDVIVDMRKQSPTYGKWDGFEISAANFRAVLIPQGFAHGFCTLAPDTEVLYKVDRFYEPKADSGIRWNDPWLSIPWPVTSPVLSAKDQQLPFLRDFVSPF
jgi:dTDP-4-dehydrorhamnose 3,5-epimerase